MLGGTNRGRPSGTTVFTLERSARSMLRQPGFLRRPLPVARSTSRPDDLAMLALQYGTAILAIAVAILLKALR
jgi:hypothetical protein